MYTNSVLQRNTKKSPPTSRAPLCPLHADTTVAAGLPVWDARQTRQQKASLSPPELGRGVTEIPEPPSHSSCLGCALNRAGFV